MFQCTAMWMRVGVVGLMGMALARGAQAAPPDEVERALGGLQKAMASEDYAGAGRQAEQLLRAGPPEARAVATRAYGRILLGQKRTAEARQYVARMKRGDVDAAAARLVPVCEAWLAALEGRTDAAVGALQRILDARDDELAAAEAADVLAQIHLHRENPGKAREAIEAGLAALEYFDARGTYIETILRRRLEVREPQDPAEKLYRAAEKLRGEGKFSEAGRDYVRLVNGFPKSPWVHPAGFRIGQCLAELGHDARALEHWNSFLQREPAGPWRGQARVAVMDLTLSRRFNLSAATEHASLAGAVLDNMEGNEVEESWARTAYAIRLRQGLIAMVRREYEPAVAAMEKARPPRGEAPGLRRLLEAARARQPVNPPELSGLDQASVAAAFGGAYNLLGHYQQALEAFAPVLSGAVRGGSAAHRSWAGLGVARARQALGQDEQAAAAYRQSLSEHPRAAWHDQTLRELALLIERTAETRAKDAPEADAGKSAKPVRKAADRCTCGPARPPSAERLARVRAEALPVWTALITRHSASPHVPEALHRIGVLHAETRQWHDATTSFDRLTRDHPDSGWTGDAHVSLVDMFLERHFDLAAAERHAAAAVEWLEEGDRAGAAGRIGAEIYVRAGLLACLQDRPAQAVAWFEKASASMPRNETAAYGKVPTGVERLIAVARGERSITPDAVRQAEPRARLIIMLADLYSQGNEFDRAHCLYDRALTDDKLTLTPEQQSWALFQRGRTGYRLRTRDSDYTTRLCGRSDDRTTESVRAALADYQSASLIGAATEWAPEALLLAGNIEWNFRRDVGAAVTLWQRLLSRYPESARAERAAYYVAIAQMWGGREQEARRALEQFLRDRPDSRLAGGARNHLASLNARPSGVAQ